MTETIFNVFVQLKSKTQLLRLLNACKEKGLVVTEDNSFGKSDRFRMASHEDYGFGNWFSTAKREEVTEAEFIELLKQHKG